MTLKIPGQGWPHHPAKIIRCLAPSGCKPAVTIAVALATFEEMRALGIR